MTINIGNEIHLEIGYLSHSFRLHVHVHVYE